MCCFHCHANNYGALWQGWLIQGVQSRSPFFVAQNPFSALYVMWIFFFYCSIEGYSAYFNHSGVKTFHPFFNMWACYLQNSMFHKPFSVLCEIICKLPIRRSKSSNYYFLCYQKVVWILNSLLKIWSDCKSNSDKSNIYTILCHPEGHVIRKLNIVFWLSRANEFVDSEKTYLHI